MRGSFYRNYLAGGWGNLKPVCWFCGFRFIDGLQYSKANKKKSLERESPGARRDCAAILPTTNCYVNQPATGSRAIWPIGGGGGGSCWRRALQELATKTSLHTDFRKKVQFKRSFWLYICSLGAWEGSTSAAGQRYEYTGIWRQKYSRNCQKMIQDTESREESTPIKG